MSVGAGRRSIASIAVDEIRQIRYVTPTIFFVVALLLGGYLEGDTKNNALFGIWKTLSSPDIATTKSTETVHSQETTQSKDGIPSKGSVQTKDAKESRDASPSNGPVIGGVLTLLAGTAVIVAGGTVINAVGRALLALIAGGAYVVFWPWNRGADRLIIRWEVCQRLSYFERIRRDLAPTMRPEEHLFVFEKYRYFADITFDHENLYKDALGLQQWLARRWSGFLVRFNSAVALLLALIVGWCLLGIHRQDWRCGIALIAAILFLNAGVAWHQTQKMHEFQSYRCG